MKKQFCLRGHDTFVVGRNMTRMCCECARIKQREYYKTPRGLVITLARSRRTYRANVEKVYEKHKRWKAANPEAMQAARLKSRAKYKGVNFWVEAARESV